MTVFGGGLNAFGRIWFQPKQNCIISHIFIVCSLCQELVSLLVGHSGEAVQWLTEKFALNLSVITQLGRVVSRSFALGFSITPLNNFGAVRLSPPP